VENVKAHTGMIKQLPAIFTTHLDLDREITHEFNNLCHMVIILGEKLALTLWVEEIFSCEKLKNLQQEVRHK
jgi:hypothetical protein